MEQKLHAIQKKIDSTNEQLNRLSASPAENSPESLLALEMLQKRLSDLNGQKNSFSQASSFSVPKRSSSALQFTLLQENQQNALSLRALSYFLYGLQHLIDLLTIMETESVDEQDPQLLVQIAESEPFTAEIHLNPGAPIQAKSIESLLELFEVKELPGAIPPYLLDWNTKTFAYVQKWLAFLLAHKVTITVKLSAKPESESIKADPSTLKMTLEILKQIRKTESEKVEISGILNEMNMEQRSIEILDPQNRTSLRAKGSLNLLKRNRHLLGEPVSARGFTMHTENLTTGEIKSQFILNEVEG